MKLPPQVCLQSRAWPGAVRSRRNEALGVVGLRVVPEHPTNLSRGFVFVDIDAVVLERPEEALRSGSVQTLTVATHRNFYAGLFQKRDIVRVRKMAAFVAVDDFRLSKGHGPLQAGQHKRLVQGAEKLVIHDVAAIPADDHEEIQETLPRSDVVI